ncbi:nicotinate-nucleotide--dimethylbenzimidazole phosphoribosyltransferase [Cognatishimia sp. F0-27]|uniref:nicotinate-nucleotide--dimethylbenzimidazole phosphoribosyltransferase n=1 Tax=Cognatishimia sp. F0-27 TaxID=2816855 RepID=UPI001D0C864C|nr:nicotinate-nucleotide--dimethylbenzimidazole phosphoribosyltransferase [Cognatishimia sp. F0-27]
MTDFDAALARKIDTKTKPRGALGRIEAIAAKIARLQGRLDPVMETCRLVIFAADHGIAEEGVSAYPSDVTRQMVLNFAAGGAAANVFARVNGLDLDVVNAGVRGGPFGNPGVIEKSLGEGTASFLTQPAMTADQTAEALSIGREIGGEGPWPAVAFGEMGIGNTSSASMVAHHLTRTPLKDLVGRGTGLDDEGFLRKVAVLEKANARVTGALTPEEVLREFGGFEIAMMTGAMLGAVHARKLVLVDGFIASSAALAAARIDPAARDAMVFCTLSIEPGHRLVLSALGADPLLDLRLGLGEGTGAALAWPIVKSAAAMLNEMASFEEAGVSDRD